MPKRRWVTGVTFSTSRTALVPGGTTTCRDWQGLLNCRAAGADCGPTGPSRENSAANGAMVEPVKHRRTKEAATDMFEPKSQRATSRLYRFELHALGRACAPGDQEKSIVSKRVRPL